MFILSVVGRCVTPYWRLGAIETDNPDFVVAGIDLDLTLADLAEAGRFLRRGAQLIVSNPDAKLPDPVGTSPEAGAVAAFLETASGVKAISPGKPHRGIFAMALERMGLTADEALVIGDTEETDIAGAEAAGIRSVLVETGNVGKSPTMIQPTVRVASIGDLSGLLFV